VGKTGHDRGDADQQPIEEGQALTTAS